MIAAFRRILYVLVVGTMAALVQLSLCTGAALSHGLMIAQDPANGAVLQTAPASLRIEFNEPVRPLVARLTGPDGATRLMPPPQVQGRALTYPLPSDLGRGSHLLSWRVTSADGHPLAGASMFSIGAASAVAQDAQQVPLATRTGLWALRAVLLAALLMGVGGAVFRAFLSPGARLGHWAWPGLALLPAVAAFQGLELLGQPLTALASLPPWREGLTGPPGAALVLAAGALLLSLLRGRVAAGVALVLLGLAAAASGHAATAPPQALMRPAIALHVVAAALWIGALAPLGSDLAQGRTRGLLGFSRLIPWGLAILLASGAAITLVQVQHPAALWQTGYGRVLLVKLALVAVLLAVALWNRLRLTPLAQAGRTAPLRHAVRVELMLAILILATVSLWRFTPPPRSLAVGQSQQIVAANGLSARVTVQPPRTGLVTLRLDDWRLDGKPFAPLSVRAELAKPAYGIGPFSQETAPKDGVATVGPFLLALDGYWVLSLDVVLSEFRSQPLRDLIEIAPALDSSPGKGR